jgi:leucyl aminopeptidase
VLRTLVARSTARTVPIIVVDQAAYTAWRKKQSATRRAWLDGNAFVPSGHRVCLVPGSGGVSLALLGTSDSGPWTWATAAQRLPPGRYRIESVTSPEEATDAAIGWALASYAFDRYLSSPDRPRRELVWPAGADRDEARRQLEAISLVRDLINTPAEALGPAELARAAVELGEAHAARVKTVAGKALRSGYPMIHAVGRGSARGPRLVDLQWGDAKRPKLTLVGKGVCFDSGGLDLKNAAGMLRMKKDMGGAAIALGLAKLVMDAELPVRLRVLIPAVENLPGPDAMRPLDVLKSRKGLTVEVSNTDAEGRLVLADALAEADSEGPDLLIDIATLTGSARLALGTEITPFFTTDKKVADELAKHARRARDPVWRMPLHGGYRRHLESKVADLKNAPSTQLAGAITAALFLREFVEKTGAWLHLDVFGWIDNAKAGRPLGGEATGMRAVWELLRARYPKA